MMMSIFSSACYPSICLLWRNVYLGILPIFWLGCLFFYWIIWAVWIFWKLSPLLGASFANTFSQSIAWLFIWFMVSFAVQKLINLTRSHLFIFAFISIALRGWPKKTLVWFISECFAYVLFYSYGVVSYIYNFKPFWVYFCMRCEGVF